MAAGLPGGAPGRRRRVRRGRGDLAQHQRDSLEDPTDPSRTRANAAGADLRVENPQIKVFDGGWVFQATTVGTTADGDPVRIPNCLVVIVENGRIARFEEYADSRAVEALFR
ncbi:nuclear transport factor 2 family protein [Aeromicrobium sp. UC242_57]|uniref:nuclear transport factor 2 family protein n=1 Tax=Aeromicrobium sp. UC242_57 TaxID=3374624 RepID=UPI0037AD1652